MDTVDGYGHDDGYSRRDEGLAADGRPPGQFSVWSLMAGHMGNSQCGHWVLLVRTDGDDETNTMAGEKVKRPRLTCF